MTKPLRIRVELAPGFGRAWLSCLAVCCWLRGVPLYGISYVDE